MEIRRNILRLLAVLFAFALVAAACGSSDDDDSSSSSSESATETAEDHGDDSAEEAEEDTGGTLSQDAVEKAVAGEDDGEAAEEEVSDCPQDRSNVEGIFAEADCNRDAIIAMITAKMDAGEWGVNSDNHLIGPEGMDVDLNVCPADWDDHAGLTDNQMRFGQTTVQSGNLAAYGNLSVGMQIWFDYINSLDVLSGRDIEFIIKDDGYVAAQTMSTLTNLSNPRTFT